MPITTSQMANNNASVTFEYMGESVTLQYYPGRVTGTMLLTMSADIDQTSPSEDLARLNARLVDLIKEWDVLEGDAMFPLDPTRMLELPLNFIKACLYAITNDMRPN